MTPVQNPVQNPAPSSPAQRPGRSAQRERSALTWNALGRSTAELAVETDWPAQLTPEWAWGGASGRGVRVCVVDSGVEGDHADVGPLQRSYAVTADEAGELRVQEVPHGDTCGHGTACAGVIRALAPECELYSVRVLGERYSSSGDVFLTGLRWAVAQGYDVISVSLSTTRGRFAEALHSIADEAFFRGSILVCAAHNTPVESYPWRFASVLSVGSHAVRDPELLLYNPDPPVEFFAHGTDVEVAWLGGTRTRVTGNSFATPHVAGYCALALSKHPRLTPFQVKNLLHLLCGNVRATA